MANMKTKKKPRKTAPTLGAVFEDTKLKRYVRVDQLKDGVAMLGYRRGTTGRFTETKEPIKATSLRAPRFKLWRSGE